MPAKSLSLLFFSLITLLRSFFSVNVNPLQYFVIIARTFIKYVKQILLKSGDAVFPLKVNGDWSCRAPKGIKSNTNKFTRPQLNI